MESKFDLGYGEIWESFEKPAKEENWDNDTKERISKQIQEGINLEIKELVELGVLKNE